MQFKKRLLLGAMLSTAMATTAHAHSRDTQITIIHTGDFKVDHTPLDGQHFDFHRFAELGSTGVLALLGDSVTLGAEVRPEEPRV